MYYSMEGIGEAVLIDSQNPPAGSYDPSTHTGVSQATRTWYDQLFNTANKAIDAFNPNLKNTGTPQPEGEQPSPTWVKPVVIITVASAVGYGIYRYVKSSKKK